MFHRRSSRTSRTSLEAASDPTHPHAESEGESEEALTSLVGVIQAIVSLYAMEEEGCDRIRYIDAGQLHIAFLLKAPLYLVAISDWAEPEAVVRRLAPGPLPAHLPLPLPIAARG